MSAPDVPNFAAQLDPNQFKVPGAQELAQHLDETDAATKNVNFDWTQVHGLLGQLAGQQGGMDARASGKGLTAGAETAMGQDDLGASSSNPADLGKALMRLGSKAPTQQAMQQASAQGAQQGQAMDQATALKEAQAAARIDIYKKELALQDQKFQIGRAVQQSKDGLDLAQLQMRNMFNAAVSNATNATDLAELTKKHQDFSEIMQYLATGIGTAAQLTAAGAGAMQASDAAYANAPASQANPADLNLAASFDRGSANMVSSANNGMASFYGVK